MSSDLKPTVWIDADACPNMIKNIIYKASNRLSLSVCLVANNYIHTPTSQLITSVQVPKGADVADNYIVEHLTVNDIVITADVPLAALVIDKGGVALNPRGELYTTENVRERLSKRDFMQNLRDFGIETGGPQPLGKKDSMRFANAFDRLLARMKLN